jgi:hypothetical protein
MQNSHHSHCADRLLLARGPLSSLRNCGGACVRDVAVGAATLADAAAAVRESIAEGMATDGGLIMTRSLGTLAAVEPRRCAEGARGGRAASIEPGAAAKPYRGAPGAVG